VEAVQLKRGQAPDAYNNYLMRKQIYEKEGIEGLLIYFGAALGSAPTSCQPDSTTPEKPKLSADILEYKLKCLQMDYDVLKKAYDASQAERHRSFLRFGNASDSDIIQLTGISKEEVVKLGEKVSEIRTVIAVLETPEYSGLDCTALQCNRQDVLSKAQAHVATGKPSVLSEIDQVFITLTYLRLGLPMQVLALLFGGLHARTVSRIVVATMTLLRQTLSIIFPFHSLKDDNENEITRQGFRDASYYQSDFFDLDEYNIEYIIDCFEIFCLTPTTTDEQRAFFSSYKHHHTVKFLVAINRRSGRVCYISPGFPGGISDNDIVKRSGFLNHIERLNHLRGYKFGTHTRVGILADKGFTCFEEVEKVGGLLVTPPRVSNSRMSDIATLFTRRVASTRIFVECAIRCIKVHKSIGQPFGARARGFLDDLVFVASLMTRYGEPFVPKAESVREHDNNDVMAMVMAEHFLTVQSILSRFMDPDIGGDAGDCPNEVNANNRTQVD